MGSGYYYPTIEQITEIHRKTVQYSGGGDCGHYDLGRLESVLTHIQNDDYYPTFVDKLTHLFFSICKFHCFIDGNKRLAITASAHFLLLNGYMAIAKVFFAEMENISYHVASGCICKELLHQILNAILDGTYESDEELKLEIYESISGGRDSL
jgi:death-on-curing protein